MEGGGQLRIHPWEESAQDPRSMKRQDFIEEQRARLARTSKRWQVWFNLVYFGALFGFFILVLCVPCRTWVQFLCLAALLGIRPLMRRYARNRFGVRCPSCGKPLAGNDAGIALFSGHCWYCHKRILE